MTDRGDVLVLFGATGDLARKKIYPALLSLAEHSKLPDRVVAVARDDWDDDDLRGYARGSIDRFGPSDPDHAALDLLTSALTYVRGDYTEDATYQRLRDSLDGASRPVLYLAIPPSLFERVIQGLADVGVNEHGRLVIEKPFGHDLASAEELNRCVLRAFPEEAVHRIDHFLAKEQVLDLLVFRLANSFLAPAWNRHHIDSVQITMAEDFGVEGRGGFYDETGAVRDVFQNHLLQVLAQVAMEPPTSADAQALRDEKVKVLRSMPSIDPAKVVRGQFAGYRDEDGVGADSEVETFVALEAEIDSWRWAGVPFYVRAGKRLPVTATDVLVEFKRPPRLFFARADCPPPHPNHLLFRLKPGEQVSISVQIKEPGDELVSRPVDLTYRYDEEREGTRENAYARLLDDAMDGDQRLFARADGVEEAWRVIDQLLDDPPPVLEYEPGSWGPEQADELIAAHGGWHCPEIDDDG
ncbi:MAG: glucose-6-phosphate dehydrogenase [Actinobacteria bacterium]|nr:glucose-6-phosphate dehydrogenase [Actinomycetota bacterium]